jgi:hypothetical protein
MKKVNSRKSRFALRKIDKDGPDGPNVFYVDDLLFIPDGPYFVGFDKNTPKVFDDIRDTDFLVTTDEKGNDIPLITMVKGHPPQSDAAILFVNGDCHDLRAENLQWVDIDVKNWKLIALED